VRAKTRLASSTSLKNKVTKCGEKLLCKALVVASLSSLVLPIMAFLLGRDYFATFRVYVKSNIIKVSINHAVEEIIIFSERIVFLKISQLHPIISLWNDCLL
jgi:hypothetical protein